MMGSKLSKFILILSVIALLIYKGCGGTFTNRWKSDEVLNEVTKNGNQIVEKIEQYKKDKGEYPDELKDLIPVYFKQIPTTKIKYFEPKFHYVKVSINSKLKEPYQIIIFPKQFTSLGQRVAKILRYLPSQEYENSQYRVLHKLVNGWAIQTVKRKYLKRKKQ